MPKREPKTAAELMRELETDLEWVARRDARARQMQERSRFYAKDEAELVSELQSLGYEIESVWDFVNNSPHPVLDRSFTGPYREAYPVLVRHLGMAHAPRIREGIIRALSVSDIDATGKAALLQEFGHESDTDLRWVLANALKAVLTEEELAHHPSIL